MICEGGLGRLKQMYDLIGGAQILAQGTTPHAHCCQTLIHVKGRGLRD